jgi:DUF4097 and DUF4098 domain-containing protein YvlB
MKQSFPSPDPVTLYVELSSGHLTTTASDTPEVTIEIAGPRADEFKISHAGKRIAVISPHGRFFGRDTHQVSITVPIGSELVTKTGSASTTTVGSLGTIALKTGSGDIDGYEFGSEVRIKSGSGDIDLGDVRGKTGISTGSGDVILGLVRATTVIKTGSGDLRVERAEADVSLTTASGDLTISAAPRGKVTARNVSGDVRIGIPSGTPVWTDINTVSGSLRNGLARVGKPAEGQPFVELRASTVSGNVLLEQV